ncbi:alpha/beta hydrolase [Nocardiopsis sp. N85]|uniref:alpha/beta fold hydrolase n=1 Tax=Nocardiopsis sp. N85 TaxID=3029400 RepID=UPI00237F5521|nr:alpha/beta hydrolase [Nocardiopsis sp. N85]MDE3722183.1 alpha/beta hydrolase [Nocardiopsis sp. N85]
MIADPHERTVITRPEGPLSVVTAGDHGTPVVLLSGGGRDNALLSWRHLIPALARDHRVFAPDWPKQGRSRPWRGTADHAALLSVVDTVLDHFALDRVALVGLSQGGALTLSYAIEHPARVDRLVAIAPAGTLSFPPLVHQLLWLTARSRFLNTTLPGLMLRSRSGVERFVRTALIPGPVPDFDAIVDEIVQESRANGSDSSDWQNASIGFTRMNVDLLPRLGAITCPALFVQGDRDVGVSPRRTAAAAARVPGARLETIEGAGHWVNRQCPDRVEALVRAFLA